MQKTIKNSLEYDYFTSIEFSTNKTKEKKKKFMK